MTPLFVPDWAEVIVRRPQAALARANDSEWLALLFVGADGKQKYITFRKGHTSEAAGAALAYRAASEADVLAVTGAQ